MNSVLLVEDDEIDVLNVKRAFRKLAIPATIHVARNGLEALALLRGEQRPRLDPLPDLILLDMNMPKMGGLEFVQEVRRDPGLSRLKIFLFIPDPGDEERLNAMGVQADGYLVKSPGTEAMQTMMAKFRKFPATTA